MDQDTKLGRNSAYRIAALQAAVTRAGQDGGIQGDKVDVLIIANVYYQWLTGNAELRDPILEMMEEKGVK